MQAFCAGLDAGELPVDGQAQAKLMQATGLLLRAMTEGLMQVLRARTSFKNELRLEKTEIRARENNPFKFSVDAGDALAHLLLRPNPGFLPPLKAAREAFDDIQYHEMADRRRSLRGAPYPVETYGSGGLGGPVSRSLRHR